MPESPPFSRRFGFQPPEREITIREDAPDELRYGLVMLANNLGLGPHSARLEVCGVLLVRPDPSNWSAYPNVFDEVQYLVATAPWYRVNEIAEGFHSRIASADPSRGKEFEDRLNELFGKHGIGWQMQNGEIVIRGSEAFSQALTTATELMKGSGRGTAANEMHEALRDISRRPAADITGAIQHSMAALECVARDVTGSSKTLGQLVSDLALPKPLDSALEKLWGFASEQGRHIREGRAPRFEDAELVVTVAAAVSAYLLHGSKDQQ